MPIYDISDWAALQGQIKAGGQAVSGMTMAEAEAALGTQSITTQGGNTLHVYNPGAQSSVQPPLQFPGTEQPVDAYWEYVGNGGNTTATGALSSKPSSINNSNLTLTETAGGTAGIAGLLSMNLPTAAAAIAPIAGVALGAGLYSLNPELWEKISRALLPFCYEDSGLLPVAVTEDGTTYFPKETIDAVKDSVSGYLLHEVTAPTSTLQSQWSMPIRFSITSSAYVATPTSDPDEGQYYFSTSIPVRMYCVWIPSTTRVRFYLFSTSPFEYRWKWFSSPSTAKISSYNGKQWYEASFGTIEYGGVVESTIALNTAKVSNPDTKMLNYQILFGSTEIESGPGITPWSGVEYPSNPTTLNVFTRYNAEGNPQFLPFYPVTTPVGDPGVSVPSTTPDITVNPEPAPAINPWISPDPAPGTYPAGVPQSNPAQLPGELPNYTPNLDPNADPSQEPAPEPAPEPDPAPNENDSGTSPTPSIPLFPSLPSAAAGLLHVYNPTQGQIDAFGSWLWATFSGDLIDTISKLFNDPMDAVIGLHELYATPAVSGSSTIRAGFLDSGVSSNLVGSRYTTINCGSVVVPEYYQNYLDYSPYTKCYIYLPFVGIVPVLADDIVGNAINIKYNVDSYTGCCIAIITVARGGYSSTVYQFEGNCAVEIPITSGYQSTLVGGLIALAGTAITGNPHAGIAASTLGRANLGKNDVSHSGCFGSSYGAMGAKVPYIIVKRPTQKSVVNYNEEYGLPAHKRVKIGDCSGYLRAREVHVISPTATDEEKKRIEEMLKEGVFVK